MIFPPSPPPNLTHIFTLGSPTSILILYTFSQIFQFCALDITDLSFMCYFFLIAYKFTFQHFFHPTSLSLYNSTIYVSHSHVHSLEISFVFFSSSYTYHFPNSKFCPSYARGLYTFLFPTSVSYSNVSLRIFLVMQQDRRCTYNLILRHVRATIVVMEK